MTAGAFAPFLVAASAAIVLLLGLVHLLYTFHGAKLHPRDATLMVAMRQVSPVLTRQTTMWKAWVGFALAAIVTGAWRRREPGTPRCSKSR